jgi:trehalose 6-phosphate synthase
MTGDGFRGAAHMGSHESVHDFVIVANRLPVERCDGPTGSGWRPSPGGLVRALLGLLRARDGVWVGWSGAASDNDGPTSASTFTRAGTFTPAGTFTLDGVDLNEVDLSAAQIAAYYEQVSNGALWPLYHDAIRPSVYDAESWAVYRQVNAEFAERAAAVAAPGATVWVHDYHLQLVPAMLRSLRTDLRIGFFLHIPFPPQELFMRLPWREEIIEGLLGADLIGFQRGVAADNFCGLANRLLDVPAEDHVLRAADGRFVRVGSFPISIDVHEIEAISTRPETGAAATAIRARLGYPDVVMLGVDRLDYTKGIEERLLAFQSMLRADGHKAGVVRPSRVMVQVAVPSRETVGDYQSQRERVEQLVGAINGEFATLGHPAVHYLHQSLPLDELIALYCAADVMLVTPLRDGMNLVAKEFVASRLDGGGVLVLSEFAGAVDEFGDAIVVNPHDPDALVNALQTALSMDTRDARERMRRLRAAVIANDVQHWAANFLDQLRVVPA